MLWCPSKSLWALLSSCLLFLLCPHPGFLWPRNCISSLSGSPLAVSLALGNAGSPMQGWWELC